MWNKLIGFASVLVVMCLIFAVLVCLVVLFPLFFLGGVFLWIALRRRIICAKNRMEQNLKSFPRDFGESLKKMVRTLCQSFNDQSPSSSQSDNRFNGGSNN
jgi:Flp pilus assembly protein TadB